MKFQRSLVSLAVFAVVASVVSGPTIAQASPKKGPTGYLYTSENDIRTNHNSVAGYAIWPDGRLTPLKQGMVKTGGTGTNNSFIPGVNQGNGKLGPMDNDTPVVSTPNGKFVYVVNGHSDTIAGFAVGERGVLTPVPRSPFPSRGINPASLTVDPTGRILAVANRNEDPARQDLINSATPNVTTFTINDDGSLTWTKSSAPTAPATFGLGTQTLPTQVLFPSVGKGILFANNFRLDVDSNVEGSTYSQVWATSPQFNGNVETYSINRKTGAIAPSSVVNMPDVPPAVQVGSPSIPLNIWSHPKKKILYVDLVTRNAIGVFTYDDKGSLNFVTSVPSTGRAVCWLRTNAAGTRLYQISSNPNESAGDQSSSIEVFDISGANALSPVELQHVSIPTLGLPTFLSDRGRLTPSAPAIIPTLSPDDRYFYVGLQRVNQTPLNTDPRGNFILGYKVRKDGTLSPKPVTTVDLAKDGFATNSRAWGLAAVSAR